MAVIVAVVALGILNWTALTGWVAGNADAESIPTTSAVIEVNALEYLRLDSREHSVLVDSAWLERATLAHAAMVNSTVVLEAALAMDQVKKTQWFSREPASALERLRESISVNVLEGTNLIAISFTGDASAEETAELATSVAVACVMDVRKNAGAAAESWIAVLRDQLRVRQGQLKENRNSMARVRRGVSPSDLAAQGGSLREMLRDSGGRLSDAAALVTLRRGQLETTKKLVEAGALATSYHVRQCVAQDYRLRLLLDEQAKVASQLRAINAGADAKGRRPEGLAKQLALLAETIARREKTLTQQAVVDIHAERQEAVDAAIARLIMTQEEYSSVEKRVQDIETILIMLQQLAEGQASIEEQIERLDRRITEVTLNRNMAVPVSLRRRAEMPDDN